MKKYWGFIAIYLFVVVGLIATAIGGSKLITTISENSSLENRTCIIIDAGHGGVDGGATSCTGILESEINLDIALKLEDLCHLLGFDTKMIRRTDISIHTEGSSIAAKKISDLRQRVKIVNETENAVLVSIHQNYFSESKYSGTQFFYAKTEGSKELAKQMQDNIKFHIATNNTRRPKAAEGVYLMQHIDCTAVLVECGFISNPEEEAKLRDKTYQNKLCSVIVTTLSNYLDPIEFA